VEKGTRRMGGESGRGRAAMIGGQGGHEGGEIGRVGGHGGVSGQRRTSDRRLYTCLVIMSVFANHLGTFRAIEK